MREYRIRYGQYKGSHSIYESVAEFKKHNPNVPIIRWAVDMDYKAVQTGSWIEAEDGYIVQCLKVSYIGKGKTTRTAIRFPMGNKICYDRVTKPTMIPHFFGMYTHQAKDRFSDVATSFGGRADAKMIMWAEYVLDGMHPFDAYRIVFNDRGYYTGPQMMSKIIELIHNKHVRKAVMSFINSFSKKLKIKYDDDEIIKMIDKHMKALQPGTALYASAIKMFIETYQNADKLMPRLPAHSGNGGQIEEAEEAEFEDKDPPLLEKEKES